MSDAERRELLKRGMLVLGAGLLIQPNGGVFGAEGQEKKEDKKEDEKVATKEKKGANEKKAAHKKAIPKKDG
jgi:hypothetical protein